MRSTSRGRIEDRDEPAAGARPRSRQSPAESTCADPSGRLIASAACRPTALTRSRSTRRGSSWLKYGAARVQLAVLTRLRRCAVSGRNARESAGFRSLPCWVCGRADHPGWVIVGADGRGGRLRRRRCRTRSAYGDPGQRQGTGLARPRSRRRRSHGSPVHGLRLRWRNRERASCSNAVRRGSTRRATSWPGCWPFWTGAPDQGIYHCANSGQASRYDVASAIAADLGADPTLVRPIGTAQAPPRPATPADLLGARPAALERSRTARTALVAQRPARDDCSGSLG